MCRLRACTSEELSFDADLPRFFVGFGAECNALCAVMPSAVKLIN